MPPARRKGSRTADHSWRKLRDRTRADAQASGLTYCPICTVPLNWEQGQQPNSAEVDHIIPHSLGGTDTAENLRVICRSCNQSRGNRPTPKARGIQARAPLKVSRAH